MDNGDGTATDLNTRASVGAEEPTTASVHDKDNTYTWNTTVRRDDAERDGVHGVPRHAQRRRVGGRQHDDGLLRGPLRLAAADDRGAAWNPGRAVPRLHHQPVHDDSRIHRCRSFYWSSSTYSVDPGRAWGVYFGDGDVVCGNKSRRQQRPCGARRLVIDP